MNAKPISGTKDYLPGEVGVRDYVQNVVLDTYRRHGFQRIQTPMMEDLERLDKSEGGENLNLMFKILKRGDKLKAALEGGLTEGLADSGLRYDLTVPLSRYFANNRERLRFPFKCIQMDRCFRAERPQKGRYREFYQCDIDIVGDASIMAEMELITVTAEALTNIGFKDFTVRVNDRRILTGLIRLAGFAEDAVEGVCMSFDKIDKIGVDGVKEELLQKGYDQGTVEAFYKLVGEDVLALDGICDANIVEDVKRVVQTAGDVANGRYEVVYDKSLVRGMGYYTGMVFEITCKDFRGSIAGGGRYDEMIGKFLKESVPAVGFSIGFERITSVLVENGFQVPGEKKEVALLYGAEDDFLEVLRKRDELGEEGYVVNVVAASRKMSKQLNKLQEWGVGYVFVFGRDGAVRELSEN